MSNRTPLIRMIFLVLFIIIVLVIFSTRLSNNISFYSNDPIFQETIIWQNNHKAYTLLLHSASFNDSSISAYSVKLDSFITFPALASDFTFIHSKMQGFSYQPLVCTKCHHTNAMNY